MDKKMLLEFLDQKIEYQDELAAMNWGFGQTSKAQYHEERSQWFSELRDEIDNEFTD